MYKKMFCKYLKGFIIGITALVVGLSLALVPGESPALADPPEPYLVKDIYPGSGGSHIGDLTDVNGTLFFLADDGVHGIYGELWKSDGTEAGTVLVKDIRPGSQGSPPGSFTNFNGMLFLGADDGAHGSELWKSDGTEAGTVMVKDIYPGSESSGAGPFVISNNMLFFGASDGVNGKELWKSDGTEAGTVLVKDIIPGSEGSMLGNLIDVNGTLFFIADDGVHGRELWKSDGTDAGTVLVKDINPGSEWSVVGESFTNVNGILFFYADDGVHGDELWKSDGTEAGTVLVKDIRPGSDMSWAFEELVDVNGILFLRADDGVHGSELWKSDGTESGTVLVKDINPGSEGSRNYAPSEGTTSVTGTLFFSAHDGDYNDKLWKSDGTEAGTILVKDVVLPEYLTDLNDTLYFGGWVDDGVHGDELWKSDGTEEGTVMVKDIYPGSESSFPYGLIISNNILFFSADDGIHGKELWALSLSTFNEPPSISGTQSGQTVDDNASIDLFTGVTISDPDDDTLTVIVSLDNAAKGELTNLGGFVEGPSGTYTFDGSPASATTAIQGLTFNPTENRKTPGNTDTTTFTISADDDYYDPVTDDTTTVIATSINDPPTIEGAVAGQTVDDNATIDPFTGVTISDPDKNTSLTVIVSLDDPDKGTLTNLGGFVSGPAGTYTFTGSPTESTSAIQGLTFVPTENRVPVGDTETTTFTISADDGIIASPVTDDTTTVIATSINDPPTIEDTVAGQMVDDDSTIDPFSAVTIADPDVNTTLTVTVTLDNADKGSLISLGGFVEGPNGTYTFAGSPTASTTAIRGLTFVPTEGRVPEGETETTTFTISADDGIADPVIDDTTTVIITAAGGTKKLFLPLVMK